MLGVVLASAPFSGGGEEQAFALDDLPHRLVDGVLAQQVPGEGVVGELADAVDPGFGLGVDTGRPAQLHEQDVAGLGERVALAPSGQADHNDPGLAGLEELLLLLGVGLAPQDVGALEMVDEALLDSFVVPRKCGPRMLSRPSRANKAPTTDNGHVVTPGG